jgi:peptide deformylase
MTVLRIVSYPDPVLAQPGAEIAEFDEALRKLSDDMFETMYAAQGVGLAAHQIGRALRMFVMDCEETKLVAVNPEIVFEDGEQLSEEGCLSVGSVFVPVRRSDYVGIRAKDLSGTDFEFEGRGLVARCLQHEIGHLNGRLFIDGLSSLKREMVLRKFRKAVKRDLE